MWSQHWTAWGWGIIKREKMKNFTKNHFFLEKKNDYIFQKKWKFSKSHFFRRSQFSNKNHFFEKSDFLKFFIFEKCHRLFFQEKKTFFVENFIFSLFMISHPQAIQCWASNSNTYTFGHGLYVRHFFKNPKNPEKSSNRTNRNVDIDH